jgi:hypothetical protein
MSIFDSIEQAVRDRQPIYPPEQSAAGTNTWTVKTCRAVGYTPGYCVCLNKLKAFERDEGLASYPECHKAIGDKSCPAISLRQEEQLEGKALYYVDRALLREEMEKTFAASTPSFRPTKVTPAPTTKPQAAVKPIPAPTPQDCTVPASVTDGYAAAINAAIKEAAAAPATVETEPEPKVDAPSPSPVKKGLSILEIARMQMGKSTTGE